MYLREEQRRQAGCSARRLQVDLHHGLPDAGESKPEGGSDSGDWLLGDINRHRGSLHSDIWEGTAEELSERNVIGIYPVSGWWKEQQKRDRSEAGARYALVVSIECDTEGIDIWTPVS